MPRYYFHSQTDTRVTDTEGTELATPAEARKQAIARTGVMMADAAEMFWGSRPWNVSVTDQAGLVLWEIYVDGVTSVAGQNVP